MTADEELRDAERAGDTGRFLELQERVGRWREIPPDERRIKAGGVLEPGDEAPWITAMGSCLVRVYDIRRGEDGRAEFGVGNETLPILAWVNAEDFFEEWPQ